MQSVQQASTAEVFASYRSKSLHLEFKMKANEIFAEHVLSDSSMIKHYPFASSCFNLQEVPPESQKNQIETIQWLLRNRFIPSIQNQHVVFTSSENQKACL